ncbi:hypothetical protein ARMGADRAFT_1092622 [Armillaria gallica]|uniref:Uncharacterized protein n=1 Tax=Armillaria gallica TaxID=47427 RepID=A0A2H3CA88_ARMGA|nr:hypothetical protein ARMGADRAFT_1092622 [Armillaria gallica]
MSCVLSSDVIPRVSPDHLPLYVHCFFTAEERNLRRQTLLLARECLQSVRYLKYNSDPSYILRVFNAGFERLSKEELDCLHQAHAIRFEGKSTLERLKRELIAHIFQGVCLVHRDQHLLSVLVGCLDFLSEFYFPLR